MALIRRHPAVTGLLTVLLLGVTVIWLGFSWRAPAAHANAAAMMVTPLPLDPVTAGQIGQFRSDAGLDDAALACLDAPSDGAGGIVTLLQSLKSWFDTNRSDWNDRRQALANQRALIRTYQSAIDNGQDQSANLAQARQTLTTLESAYDTFLSGCRTTVTSGLSDTQRALLDGMRARRSLPMPYRVLALTAQQDSDLRAALLRYEQRRSVAHDADAQSAALNTFTQERDAALGATHLQTLASLQTILPASSQRLVAAINQALPPPAEP